MDSFSLSLVSDFEGVEILWSSQLELGLMVLLVLLDGNLLSLGQMLGLLPHNLDKFFQILDFLWLKAKINKLYGYSPC